MYDHLTVVQGYKRRRWPVEILHILRTQYWEWLDPHIVEMLPRIMAHIEKRAEEDGSVRTRFEEAMRRAETFRAHCIDLEERATIEAGTLEEIVDEVARFRQAFDDARPTDSEGNPVVERRQTPRTPGTGRTGREEWT